MAKNKTTGRVIAYWARQVFVVVGSILLLLVILLLLLAAFFEERIGRIVIDEVNASLKTELRVEQAELSLIWDFPDASVSLKNVEVQGANYQEQPLLKAENLAFKFGILGLFSGNYVVESIEMEKGSIYVVQGKKGSNFEVFRQEEETKSKKALYLSIDEAVFKEVTFYYHNQEQQHEAKGLFDNAYFAGRFKSTDFDLRSTAEMKMDFIRIDGSDRFLRKEDLAYETLIEVKGAEQKYNISEIKLFVDGNSFAADGFWQQKDQGLLLNLNLESESAQLQSILALLPSSLTREIGAFNSEADMFFNASIMGLYTPNSQPGIDFSFGLKDGSLRHPDLKQALEDVSFRADFSNGEGRSNSTASFEISDFKAQLDGQELEMQLRMDNLNDPQVNFSLSGVADLHALYPLLGPGFEAGRGRLEINSLYLQGRYKDMLSSSRLSKVRMGGELRLRDVDLSYQNKGLRIPDGRIKLQENILQVEQLQLEMGESDLLLSGQAKNLLPVLLADSTNRQQAQLLFNFALQSEKFQMGDFRHFFSASNDSSQVDSSLQIEAVSRFLRGKIALRIADFQYDFLQAQQLKGELKFEPRLLQIKQASAQAMGGTVGLNSEVVLSNQPKISAYLDLQKVDIQRLFKECKNFGQSVLTNANIHGQLTSLLKVEAAFDRYGNFLDEQLYAIMDVFIENGELLNFELLQRFAKYVKIEDLQRVVFSDLKNQLRIENQTVFIPAMFIRSNAANLLISGTHRFNQDMEYRVKVNASQVIMNAFREHNSDYTPLKAQRAGLFNLYAYIKGNLYEDYKVSLGKGPVKRYLEAQLQQDMPALRNRLQEAFSQEVQNLEEPEAWKDLPGLLE